MGAPIPRCKRLRQVKQVFITVAPWVVLLALTGCDPNTVTVKLTSDQAKLGTIAIETGEWEVGHAAVDKLVDQTMLSKVALAATNLAVRSASAAKLTDQSLLAKVAMTDWCKKSC